MAAMLSCSQATSRGPAEASSAAASAASCPLAKRRSNWTPRAAAVGVAVSSGRRLPPLLGSAAWTPAGRTSPVLTGTGAPLPSRGANSPVSAPARVQPWTVSDSESFFPSAVMPYGAPEPVGFSA